MSEHWILKDGEPVQVPLLEWALWFENTDTRRVAETIINDVRVSTVFLGINHNFGGGKPLLFETMIFGGTHDEYQERYTTLEESMRGHEHAVALVKEATE